MTLQVHVGDTHSVSARSADSPARPLRGVLMEPRLWVVSSVVGCLSLLGEDIGRSRASARTDPDDEAWGVAGSIVLGPSLLMPAVRLPKTGEVLLLSVF